MRSYKFNKQGYNFNISYDENKPYDKWTQDEVINSLYYEQLTHLDDEYKFVKLNKY